MSSTHATPSSASKREQEIALILALLENKVEDLAQEIDLSKKFLPDGIKTTLTTSIEKLIENPVSPLVELRGSIDTTILKVVHIFFKKVFETNKDLIDKVLLSNSKNDRILYYIIPQNDTFENRESIFQILDYYETMDFSSAFPVDFQIVPKQFFDKVLDVELVEF